jgi:hypothetical protein
MLLLARASVSSKQERTVELPDLEPPRPAGSFGWSRRPSFPSRVLKRGFSARLKFAWR